MLIISRAYIATLTGQIKQDRGKIRKKRNNGNEYYYELIPYYDRRQRTQSITASILERAGWIDKE